MYEYKFIKIDLLFTVGEPTEDYKEIIHRESKNGWKLNQILLLPIGKNRHPTYMEIIFEKLKTDS